MNTFKSILTRKSFFLVMVAIMILFGGSGLTAMAARESLPGDALYPLKSGIERIQQNLVNDDRRAELELALAGKRLDEIKALIRENRLDKVPQTAAEFERHITLAVEAVQRLAEDNPARAAELNQLVAQELSRYSGALTEALAGLPQDVRKALQQVTVKTKSNFASGEDDLSNGNENVNANSNENLNANSNENANANSNENGNQNVNMNGNENANANSNANDNVNVNSNENGNENEDRGNDNENDANENASRSEVRIKGVVESLSPGQWVISGKTVLVASTTRIEGKIKVGDRVEVKAVKDGSGVLTAIKIELTGISDNNNNENNNMNDNSQSNDNGDDRSNKNSNDNDDDDGYDD